MTLWLVVFCVGIFFFVFSFDYMIRNDYFHVVKEWSDGVREFFTVTTSFQCCMWFGVSVVLFVVGIMFTCLAVRDCEKAERPPKVKLHKD